MLQCLRYIPTAIGMSLKSIKTYVKMRMTSPESGGVEFPL